MRPGLELLLQPRLVEPGRADLAASRPRPRASGSAAGRGRGAATPGAPPCDQHFLVAEEVGDPLLGRRPLVAARPVLEQVADRLEPELREPLLHRRPDAGQRVDRRSSRSGRKRRASAPSVRRVHGGKTGLGPAHRPSIGTAGPATIRPGTRRSRPCRGLRACRRRRRGSSTSLMSACGRLASTIARSCSTVVRRLRVRDRDREARAVGRRLLEALPELLERLLRCRARASPGRPRRPRSPGSASRSAGFPSSACARPIRPPLARNSSVSTVKRMPDALAVAARPAPRSPRPSSRARAAPGSRARASRSRPTRTRCRRAGSARPRSAAASEALWNVPESFAEMCSE